MTDQEFEILDELYFIKSYDELLKALGIQESDLKILLAHLLEKGWIKSYLPAEKEIHFDIDQFKEYFMKYYYIATKAGLLAHHGKEE